MRSRARFNDSTRPESWGARAGFPERKADQKWERNSVVVAWVRERRSKVWGEREKVLVLAVVEKVGEEVVRVSRWEALVRMEERIWAVAAWIGFLSLGCLSGWGFDVFGSWGWEEDSSSEDEDESPLSLEMLRALSRWKDGEVVVARLARRDCTDVVGSRAAKRFSSGEIVSSSDVRRWDWSLILRMTRSSSFSSRRS